MTGPTRRHLAQTHLDRHTDLHEDIVVLADQLARGGSPLGAVQFGVFGTGAVAMALVIAGGMIAANVVLVLVARPWRLPVDAVEPALVAAH